MFIQHNLMSLNSFRNREINRKKIGRNLEKLTSGFRINRAGDDAAGLAISESMRSLITGLDQASRNTEAGIALIQTAAGPTQAIHALLGRLHEPSI